MKHFERLRWLNERGGRTEADVLTDSRGLEFVEMLGPGRVIGREYLPEVYAPL